MFSGNSTKIIQLPVVISLLFCMLNCSTLHKSPTLEPYRFEIFFGSTGGFTNINPVFIINSNGDVLKKENTTSEPYRYKKISKQKIDSLYWLIKESNFANLKIHQISNFTNYIEINSQQFNNRVSWFDDSQIPVALKKLFENLLSTIKN